MHEPIIIRRRALLLASYRFPDHARCSVRDLVVAYTDVNARRRVVAYYCAAHDLPLPVLRSVATLASSSPFSSSLPQVSWGVLSSQVLPALEVDGAVLVHDFPIFFHLSLVKDAS